MRMVRSPMDGLALEAVVMTRERELRHFLLLDRTEQEGAIRRLIASGMPEYTIATATGLSVEQIRRILARAAGSAPA